MREPHTPIPRPPERHTGSRGILGNGDFGRGGAVSANVVARTKDLRADLPRMSYVGSFRDHEGADRPAYASRARWMSSLSICMTARITRCDFSGSLSCRNCRMMVGTTCHDRPNLSLSQPHWRSEERR